MLEITSWTYFILLVTFFIYAVIWNILEFFQALKCYKFLKQHGSPEMYFKYYYDKIYDFEFLVEEDIQILCNYLMEIQNRNVSSSSNIVDNLSK